MCFPENARPPIESIPENLGEHADIELRSADGTPFLAHVARAKKPTGAGVVVLPDVRGLHDYYRALTHRFAEHGVDAIAFDYFGRTAGIGPRGDDFEYMPHVQQLKPQQIAEDVAAALGHLQSEEDGRLHSFFTLGFCMGGLHSWLQACQPLPLAGAIGFYGRVTDELLAAIPSMRCPLLILAAGDDQATPRERNEDFDRALTAAGKEHEIHIYEGAPHSFFDRRFSEHREACADSWERIRGFIGHHGGVPAPA